MAEYADTIIVLHQGSLVRMGPVSEVLGDEKLLDYGTQIPQIVQISSTLIRRGLPLDTIPVTEKAAVRAFKNCIEDG